MTPKKFFFILSGLLAVMVLLGGAGYYYGTQSLHQGTVQLSQRLADGEIAEEKLSRLSDLEIQYRRLSPVLTQLDEALPVQKNQSELSLQLQNIANASGMSIKSISFPASTAPSATSQTVKDGDILAMPVTFDLTGSYQQFQTFLQKQENLSRYTSVTSLDISGTGDALKFSVALNAFIKPEKK
jgi:Tfp pilus assembly protein PilO